MLQVLAAVGVIAIAVVAYLMGNRDAKEEQKHIDNLNKVQELSAELEQVKMQELERQMREQL